MRTDPICDLLWSIHRARGAGGRPTPPPWASIPVYLRDLELWDDHEIGSPEIYVKCTTGSGRTTNKIWFDYINDTDRHVMNEKLVFTTGAAVLYKSEGYVTCKVMESDGANADDYIGGATIDYAVIVLTTQDTCTRNAGEDIATFAVSRYAAPTTNLFGYPTPLFCDKYYL